MATGSFACAPIEAPIVTNGIQSQRDAISIHLVRLEELHPGALALYTAGPGKGDRAA
jgi:hypothetical protein